MKRMKEQERWPADARFASEMFAALPLDSGDAMCGRILEAR